MEEVQRKIDEQSNKNLFEFDFCKKSTNPSSKKVVKVKIMDISWLFENGKTFTTFVAFLADFERHSIFESKLVEYLLEEFWKDDQEKIIERLMIPYFFFMIIAQSFIISISA